LETCVPSAIASINWFLVILAIVNTLCEGSERI
jgi:hypothetical protein